MGGQKRHLHPLSDIASMKLLDSASFGRMVFSHRALPAVRLVSHLVVDDAVIVRARLGDVPPLALVLTFEADEIDPVTRLGWCVIVTGMAEWIEDEDDLRRYERLLPQWVAGEREQLLRIQAEFIDGYELLSGAAAA